MNLYIWRGENVLRNYTSGIVIAHADSLAEARQAVIALHCPDEATRERSLNNYARYLATGEDDDFVLDYEDRGVFDAIRQEPEVITGTFAAYKWGGE